MNKIKDFFYDKNDILVALIILAAAAFVIYLRIDVIMSYPDTLVNATVTEQAQDSAPSSGTIPEETTAAPSETTTAPQETTVPPAGETAAPSAAQ